MAMQGEPDARADEPDQAAALARRVRSIERRLAHERVLGRLVEARNSLERAVEELNRLINEIEHAPLEPAPNVDGIFYRLFNLTGRVSSNLAVSFQSIRPSEVRAVLEADEAE